MDNKVISPAVCDCGQEHCEVSYSAETSRDSEETIKFEDKEVRDKIISEAEASAPGFDETDCGIE